VSSNTVTAAGSIGGSPIPIELARKIEAAEIEAWADLFRAAPAELRRERGIDMLERGGALAVKARRLDILAFNRVIGLGLRLPASPTGFEEVLSFYAESRPPRHMVQLSPAARPDDLRARLESRGYTHHNNWVKLYARVEELQPMVLKPTALAIRRIDKSEALTFGDILAAAFDWPRETAAWVAASVGRPGWHHYLACEGDTAIATGAFYLSGGVAWLDMAGTLPDRRGRGAQTALLAHRMREAALMGAELLTLETAEERPGKPVTSLRNSRRLGLRVGYLRPNYSK